MISTPAADNQKWILTEQGDLINTAFLAKVLVMTLSSSGNPWAIIFYHGISNTTGSKSGATVAIKYASQADAIVSYNKIINGIRTNTNFIDLSSPYPILISAISPTSGTIAGGDVVTLTGVGFSKGFTITINGVPATNYVFTDSTSVEFTTPANPAGDFAMAYTDAANNQLIYPDAFTYS